MKLHHPAGSLAGDGLVLNLAPETAGWDHAGLRVVVLPAGGRLEFATGGVTDFAYAPRDATLTIDSAAGGRFAIPGARAGRRLDPRYGLAAAVPVELRGTGNCSRQVHNFATPEAFPADRLIACEVLTPGGNWSSYPPHKHDQQREGETELEEIYYYEVAGGPAGPGVAYQRVSGTPERPIDLLAEVRSGDAVVIPHGWHGPSMAAPGYDLYYLNVMAGPGPERAWRICDHPAHAFVPRVDRQDKTDPRLHRASCSRKGCGTCSRSGATPARKRSTAGSRGRSVVASPPSSSCSARSAGTAPRSTPRSSTV